AFRPGVPGGSTALAMLLVGGAAWPHVLRFPRVGTQHKPHGRSSMRWYVGVAAMLLGSVAHPADTDNPFIEGTPAFESGNKLYDECKGSSAGFNTGFCYGYIVGVADVAAALKAIDFCPPKGMTVEQTVDTV